ncbi:MAG: hypothetical protein HYT15_01815 [Candidatus Magasanikbacteria bacterium]|nr:hypothetical protein [Candidatus Magasanikbacteria bacterium]
MPNHVSESALTDTLTPLEEVRGQIPALKAGDIILIHIKRSLLRSLIRRVTKSYWDHVTAIVYPKDNDKLQQSIIIENINPGLSVDYYFLRSALRGTEIHHLNKYLNNPKKYDIGIKRVSWLTDAHRKRLSSFLVTTIDTPYWPMPYWKFFLASIWPKFRRWFLHQQRWSCSTLVQMAYYESAANWEERLKLIFKEGDLSPLEMQSIVSPAEIANSDKSQWIFNEH